MLRPPRSPLRYPGGKSRAVARILQLVPDFAEFREPMVGGGSVFLALRAARPGAKFWINDANAGLASFWLACRDRNRELAELLRSARRNERDGRKLFLRLKAEEPKDPLEQAARFFILNRITFSGTIESGGYSAAAFAGRFTESSIARLALLERALAGVRITCGDYSALLSTPGKGVFIFLDPPYLSKARSKLYGKAGDLHTSFDHARLAGLLRSTRHTWLMTYDDSPQVRALYSWASQKEWTLQYGMNNYKRAVAPAGRELFISSP